MKTKQALRTHWLEHRLTLGELQKNTLSHQIQELFFAEFPIQGAKYVHIFLPVHEKCEVRTWNMIHYIKERFPMVQVCSPRITDLTTRKMDSILLENHTSFVKNSWGIEEPELGSIVHPSQIDIVLLPLITFDLKGHRLGYGGGFYDRYLSHCTQATKIGLSYFEPMEQLPEINEFDIPMDFCVTPEKVYRF